MNMNELTAVYKDIFQSSEIPTSYFSPGRINLIGEHTDYNGGHVFPAAISFGTYALASKRTDRQIRFYSINFPDIGVIECTLDDLQFDDKDDWANYPKGMIQYMIDSGHDLSTGLDILYYGTIPNGAGLSSSASIELVTGVLVEDLFNLSVDRLALVQLGQKVENEFIGLNSGIMDQFIVGKGKKDHAILLNCDTLNYEYAPIRLENHSIIIMNTNKRRSLATSKYNERNDECQQALTDLQTELSIDALGNISSETFETHIDLIKNPVHQQRAKHVITENERTGLAFKALQAGDLNQFGEYMNASHRSLRDDYEVTGKELDTLVHAAWEQPGTIGARMTGAGFGGCAIAIVENKHVENFKTAINTIYKNTIGYEASFYEPTIADGAHKITT